MAGRLQILFFYLSTTFVGSPSAMSVRLVFDYLRMTKNSSAAYLREKENKFTAGKPKKELDKDIVMLYLGIIT